MSRHHIITALAFVVVVGALGAAYQFYFREKLQAYSAAKTEMAQLENRLNELKNKFQGYHPDAYLPVVKGAVRPFQDAANQRAAFFNMRDIWTEETVPDDQATMAKFYYGDKYLEKYNALMQAAYPQTQIPADIFAYFEVPDPESMADYAVDKKEVEEWLTRINYGSAVVRMLIDAKAVALTDLVLWPVRNDAPMLDVHTVGLSFYMRAEDLTAFLEKLRSEPRYFSVDALRIQNPMLLANYGSPYLQVDMLLSMARYREDKSTGAAGVAIASSTPGMSGTGTPTMGLFGQSLNTAARPKPRKSWWQKLWPF